MTDIKHMDHDFFDSVRSILQNARRKAYNNVNFIMVEAYWKVGQRIVEEEQKGKERAGYGDFLIRELSRRLGDELGKGFSVANLWNFKQFFLTYPDSEKLYTLCRELSWSHYRLIMRVNEAKTREYYMREAAVQSWSVRELERQIKTRSYERLLSTGHVVNDKKSPTPSTGPHDFIKDPYILEFLGVPEGEKEHETDLEKALIAKLRDFILELGKGFSFVGRQFRISTETSHFYIDLVFYNYLLKCFVLIDLKTGKLTHQDIGQLDMYVRMFDDLKRGKDDNPTLGIILCADRDETVVRYSVLRESQQLFTSKYLRVLPTEQQLKQELEDRRVLAALHPEEEKIEKP